MNESELSNYLSSINHLKLKYNSISGSAYISFIKTCVFFCKLKSIFTTENICVCVLLFDVSYTYTQNDSQCIIQREPSKYHMVRC